MKRALLALSGISLGAAALVIGCSSSGGGGGPGIGTGGSAAAGGGNTGGANTGGGNTGGSGAGIPIDAGFGGSGGGTSSCTAGPTEDYDKDGFTVQDGDCNDCEPNANPGAYDVPGNNVDEDCDGTVDNTVEHCDDTIVDVGYGDPNDAARAIGLCQFATAADKKWGVLEAKYVKADGTPGMNDLSHGLVTAFGPNVNTQEGKRMLGLSSGTARQPTDPGWQSVGGAQMGTSSSTPPGFPKDSPACSVQTANDTTANDPAALELKIRVPTNAKSFKFQFDFYTYEFPGYVCSIFNDFFVALQSPPPPNAQSGNISFDSQNNPVSVNNGFLEVCDPAIGATNPGGKNFPCALGPGQLVGTGFENHAATGWLETQSPVDPGTEVTIRFAIWDMGDHILDSTVLIDKFEFSTEEATGSTTKPVPVPR